MDPELSLLLEPLVDSVFDINSKLDFFTLALENIVSFFYILVVCLAGVGIILLFYRFLKIFI